MSATIRPISDTDSVSEITVILHRAYARLAEMGFRYLATHQGEEVTRERLGRGEAFVAELDGRLVGTVTLIPPGVLSGHEWYAKPGVAVFGQFGVLPELQGDGIGRRLMDAVEARATELGASELACDTAEGATHLIEMYTRRGYRLVGYADWDVTNYRSVVLSKTLC